jgi:glycoprotein-N-acetylgalactosamine 3-beta-galactosyltransferase
MVFFLWRGKNRKQIKSPTSEIPSMWKQNLAILLLTVVFGWSLFIVIYGSQFTLQSNLDLHYQDQENLDIFENLDDRDEFLKREELSKWGMKRKIKILCFVSTAFPENSYRVDTIQNTWGSSCDLLIWAVNNPKAINWKPKVGENLFVNVSFRIDPVTKETISLWEKIYKTFAELYRNHLDRADYFVKLDDDSFLFGDNLRDYLQYYDSRIPRWFGHSIPYKWQDTNIVFNTGSGYVLSREALKRVGPTLASLTPDNPGAPGDFCRDQQARAEEVILAACLRRFGIVPENTLDEKGRERFLFSPAGEYESYPRDETSWVWQFKSKRVGSGENCCTERLIVAHGYKDPGEMKEMERLQKLAEGQKKLHPPPPPPKPELFLYDEDSIPFKVDKWRNRIPAQPYEEPHFTGYAKSPNKN